MFKKIVKNMLPYGIVAGREKEFEKETHINRALRHFRGTTYVEIGVKNCVCFRKINAPRKIGIDPSPLPVTYSLAPGELFCQTTSDDFFAHHTKEFLAGHLIDVALVDGLHEFTQAVRDVLNLERFMANNGVIFMHDCNPPQRENASEYLNGDVWKIACYLNLHRSDLIFFTLDCDWGVGVLTGFHSSNPQFPSPSTLATIKQLDYSVLEQQRRQILHLHKYWYSLFFFNFIQPFRKKIER